MPDFTKLDLVQTEELRSGDVVMGVEVEATKYAPGVKIRRITVDKDWGVITFAVEDASGNLLDDYLELAPDEFVWIKKSV